MLCILHKMGFLWKKMEKIAFDFPLEPYYNIS